MEPDIRCSWCGKPFELLSKKGPVPRYCKPSHRQRAWEAANTLGWRLPPEWLIEIEKAASKRDISAVEYVAKAVRRVLDGEKQ